MTGAETRAWIAEQDEDLLFADGFDEAIIGIAERCSQPVLVVYDAEKCIEILMETAGLSYVEATEHFEFNTLGRLGRRPHAAVLVEADVIRDKLIEFWPLVDVGKLNLGAGDVLVVRVINNASEASTEQMKAAFARAFPGQPVIWTTRDGPDFVVRPRVEMRAEDLVQPKRATTMD
jgi:hypothetical protein